MRDNKLLVAFLVMAFVLVFYITLDVCVPIMLSQSPSGTYVLSWIVTEHVPSACPYLEPEPDPYFGKSAQGPRTATLQVCYQVVTRNMNKEFSDLRAALEFWKARPGAHLKIFSDSEILYGSDPFASSLSDWVLKGPSGEVVFRAEWIDGKPTDEFRNALKRIGETLPDDDNITQ